LGTLGLEGILSERSDGRGRSKFKGLNHELTRIDTNDGVVDVGKLWMFVASAVALLVVALLFWAAYPQTDYAPGCSKAKFRQVRIGMTSDEVTSLIGPPLQASQYSTNRLMEAWSYSVDRRGDPLDVGFYWCFLILSNEVMFGVHSGYSLRW